jgi:serine O-acetyltransferase (EC 2.3.1.30)
MGVVIGETAEIGDDCTLYHGVTLGGATWNRGKRHPTLGNNVVVGAGAKVLGPFRVGDGARIGSNSVVVHEVPVGATVVGVPGRVVAARRPSEHARRLADRIGFDAYGLTRDMPDPVAAAIDALLDHIQQLDERVAGMSAALGGLGVQAPPPVDPLAVQPLERDEGAGRDHPFADDPSADQTPAADRGR